MTYRIMDESVMDEPADFTLEAKVDGIEGVELNPDGTTPKVTVKVTSPTLSLAITMLSQLAENNGEAIAEAALMQASDELGFSDEELNDETSERRTEFVAELSKITWPQVTVSAEAEINGKAEEAVVTIKAPHYLSVISGLCHLASNDNLQGLILSHMPEDTEVY